MAAKWLRCGVAELLAQQQAPEPVTKKEEGKDKRDADWFNMEWHRPGLMAAKLRRQNEEEWRPSLSNLSLLSKLECPFWIMEPTMPPMPTTLRGRQSSSERMETSKGTSPETSEQPAKTETFPATSSCRRKSEPPSRVRVLPPPTPLIQRSKSIQLAWVLKAGEYWLDP